MGNVIKGTIGSAASSNSKDDQRRAYFLMKIMREPVIPEDFYSVDEVARLLHISPDRVRSFAKRDNNPLPIRHFEKGARGSIIVRKELIDWVIENTVSSVDEARERKHSKYVDE